MPDDAALESRYHQVKRRIADAATKAGRSPDDIHLVAVTKYASVEQILALIALGHEDFGENRAQVLVEHAEAVRKALTDPAHQFARQSSGGAMGGIMIEGPDLDAFSPATVRWHMIGHMQRNKVKTILPYVRLTHSVDSLRLVEEIHAWAIKREKDVDILVQVNCSGEEQKHGCLPAAAPHLCEQIDSLVHLRLRGLMTIARNVDDPEDARGDFERCRDIFDDLNKRGIGEGHCNILSMGMTNDLEVAIDCGANIVRVGSAIFADPDDDESA